MFINYKMIHKDDEKWEVQVNDEPQQLKKYIKGYAIHSEVDSYAMLSGFLESIDFNRHCNFFIVGMENTILTESIYEKMSDFSTLTLVEITDGSQDVELVGAESYARVIADIRVKHVAGSFEKCVKSLENLLSDPLLSYNMRNTEIITSPYIKSLYPHQAQELVNILFERFYYQASGYGNSVEDILVGADNFFNNWGSYITGKPTQMFMDSYKGVPAVIVGAGPSLDAQIEDLKKIKEKVLIFAVDAAAKMLIQNGIVPDAISTIERSDDPLRFYSFMDTTEDSVFVGPNVVMRELLDRFPKRIFTGRSGDGFIREITTYIGNQNEDVGLTVANVPFSFAQNMGCDPIVFVGVDLAYTAGEKTHISEISDGLSDEKKQTYMNDTVLVRSVDGTMVPTYEYFMYTKVWFEKRIALDPNRRFINTTIGGAMILGMENMKMQELLDILSVNPSVTLRLPELYSRVEMPEEYSRSITEKALEFNSNIKKDLNALKELALSCIESIEKHPKRGRVDRIVDNRNRIDSMMLGNSAMRFLFQPIFMTYNRDFHSFPIRLDTDAEEGLVARSMHYYRTITLVYESILSSFDAYDKLLGHYVKERE